MAIYFEIDSYLPIREEFEFLRKSCYKRMEDWREGFRLRTIKLKGQVSQGLLMRMEVFNISGNEGEDISDRIGVIKYDPPIPAQLAGVVKGGFPGFLVKTDEERVQNLDIYELEEVRKHELYITEKLDGCLHENTLIKTEDGELSIKFIIDTKYKGKVLTYNLEKKEIEYKNIINYFNHGISNNWFQIELENGEQIKVTGNHKVWVINETKYKRVDELLETDLLQCID